MHLVNKRQDAPEFATLPPIIPSPTFATSTILLGDGQSIVTATQPSITSTSSSIITASPTPTQTPPPANTSSPADDGIPLSTLIPAIVVPIVVVALVAPVILYFFLTRHDRQRSKSRISSRISSRAYLDPRAGYSDSRAGHTDSRAGHPGSRAEVHPGSRAEVESPFVKHYSSETQNSKASEIMNFDLSSAIEKPLPLVNITKAPESPEEHPTAPERPERSDGTDVFEVHRGLESPIGQAITRYSMGHESTNQVFDASQNRVSIQDLTEENMRIARIANDSKVSFRGRELDEISDISGPEQRTSRHVDRPGVDELSDVSSIYEDYKSASSDRGGGILGNPEARRSGPLR